MYFTGQSPVRFTCPGLPPGITIYELRKQIEEGGRFVVYPYVFSILILSFWRSSEVFYLGPGESPGKTGVPYAITSALLGWWGIPFGLILTPIAIVRALFFPCNVNDKIYTAYPELIDDSI